ncbi:MAG: glycosyltransferase family 2 protein [Lachnospiraceae bacterium]|nr:glycosyltransferase family 2 protein [Lachnospiraceae bacterium]
MNISVIIPTYNRAPLIERAIRSILEQTYKPLEIIVVDDGSTDNTREVVESIGDPAVKYCYKENGGAGSARNYGVERAQGDWIAFHDSDDVWRPDKLKIQTEYAKKHPEYNLIYSKYEMHFRDGSTTTVPYEDDIELLEGNILHALLVRNSIGTPTVLVKKQAFFEIGGFEADLRCIEDWNFVIRFSERNLIGFVNKTTVDAYRLDAGVSANMADMYEERCRTIVNYRATLENYNLFDVAVKFLFETAESHGDLDAVKRLFMAYISLG